MKGYYVIFFVFFSFAIYAQDSNISITQLDKPLKIDGNIDLEWSAVDSIILNYQLEPDYGKLPSRKTTVKVAQFNENLYFLFICSIQSSNEITANIQQRDRLNLNDDLVSILLDTYNDNHNAVLFQINPLSTIADAKITTIDGVRADFSDGWGLVRASNTTPILVLRFEADTDEALRRIKNVFRQQMLAINAQLRLPF